MHALLEENTNTLHARFRAPVPQGSRVECAVYDAEEKDVEFDVISLLQSVQESDTFNVTATTDVERREFTASYQATDSNSDDGCFFHFRALMIDNTSNVIDDAGYGSPTWQEACQ
ncbi:MAG: hypothetical protein ACJAZO_003893 [Myxococcota bacterium]|jgi:hypothetical protein